MATAEGAGLDHRSVERRAWILGAALLAATLPFRSPPVSIGLLVGALLAVLNYRWLRGFVVGITSTGRKPSKGAVLLYSLKYLLTGLALFAVIAYDFADVVALLAGISVIFLAICWEGIRLHRT
jgi:hypothetical protein